MALNDDDKKFIKDNIGKKVDDLGKKVEKLETKSFRDTYKNHGKLGEFQRQAELKKERQALIEELQERNKKGEATLAEKIELMSQTIKTSIPQDFKDGVKAMSGTMKNGANQVGSGLSVINRKIMMSNPLTAMLYQNRDVLKALGDVGMGTLKMGWGVAKGIGYGASSVVNSAVNLFKKKNPKPLEEEVSELVEEVKKPKKEQKQNEEEKSPAEKITEMHEFLFKDLKLYMRDEDLYKKKQENILSKGLAGLGKSMKGISELVDTIASKQKLIVTGLLLGVGAIIALRKWFDSDKLGNLLKSAAKGIASMVIEGMKQGTNATADIVEQTPTQTLNNIIGQDLSSLNANTIMDYTDKEYGGAQTKYSQTQFADNGSYWMGDKIKGMKKAGVFKGDKATERLLEDPKHNWANFNANVKEYTNDKKGKKLAFPVSIKLLDAEFNKNETSSVLIERADDAFGLGRSVKESWKGAAAQRIGRSPRLVITGVITILVPQGKVIPRNTFFVVVGQKYRLIGDVAAFMRGEKYDQYQNSETLKSEANKNYVELMNQKGMGKAYSDTMANYRKKQNLKIGIAETVKDGINTTLDKVSEFAGLDEEDNLNTSTQESEPFNVPNPTPTKSSKNEDKINNNIQKIKQEENKSKQIETQPTTPQQNAGNINISAKDNGCIPRPANYIDPSNVNNALQKNLGLNY